MNKNVNFKHFHTPYDKKKRTSLHLRQHILLYFSESNDLSKICVKTKKEELKKIMLVNSTANDNGNRESTAATANR